MDFIIDTVGDDELIHKSEVIGEVNENEFANVNQESLEKILSRVRIVYDEIISEEEKEKSNMKKISSHKSDDVIDSFFSEMGWGLNIGDKTSTTGKKCTFQFNNIDLDTGRFKMKSASVDVDKEMKKTVLTVGMEQDHNLPEYNMSDNRKKAIRKAERAKTKGPAWFNMPAPEITEELKNDLQILKMRSVLDPKRHYKKNDMEVLPKYFQVGTVMDSALDHQNERLTKKERKRTIVDELMADANFTRYNKRRYTEIIEDKKATTYKTYIKEKRMRSKEAYKKNKRENKQKR